MKEFLDSLKTMVTSEIDLNFAKVPFWALLLVILGVFLILIIITAALGKKRVSGSEIKHAEAIIKDVQTEKNIQSKEFFPAAPTYDKPADLPDPESTSESIDMMYARLTGEAVPQEITEEKIVEPTDDTIIMPEPVNDDELNIDNCDELPVEDNSDTTPLNIEEAEEIETPVTPVPVAEEIAEEAIPVAEEVIDEQPEEIVEEEINFDNNIAEDVATEVDLTNDNILEEVEEEIEIAPVAEEVIEEAPVAEEVPVIEEATIVEEVEEPAPIEKVEEPSPIVEEPIVEEKEDKINVPITPAVPVITAAKTKKEPIKKKANLVKAPVSRPVGSRPKKASDVKKQSTSIDNKKNIPVNNISNFAPITKIDGDKEVMIIKLFGDKIEPSKGKYVVIKSSTDLIKPYSFALKANNGQIMFMSEGYKIHPRARQIETFRKAINLGSFTCDKLKNGDFTFRLFTAEGKLFGTGLTYPNIDGAKNAIESVKKFAEQANYIEDAAE